MAEDSDFEFEDDFVYDGRPYRFEPEYTDEELLERRRQRQAMEQRTKLQPVARSRTDGIWWCSCGHCSMMKTEDECLCCIEWDLRPGGERLGDSNQACCLTTLEDVRALMNRGVIETFFRVPKLNWRTQPQPAGSNGQLSVEQFRLVAYRIVLDWALGGLRLGPGHRKVIPSCIVSLIRSKYPSPSGDYVGFTHAE